MTSKLGKIALVLLVIAVSAMAEESKVDTAAIMKKSYNIRGGINFNSAWGYWHYRSAAGFHAGVLVDHPITLIDIADEPYLLEFHYGAQLVSKGGGWLGYKFNAYYIEAPLLFSMKKTFSETVAGRVDFGPYFALGLFGTRDVFDYALGRFDAGVIYGATMDFQKKYSLGFHMGSGMDFYTIYMTLGYKL